MFEPSFPVEDWEAIPLETYKALLIEVKEAFEVTVGETISCTDKSIKCLIAYITYLFGVGVFLLTNHYSINFLFAVVVILASAYNVYLGYGIIRLRSSFIGGLLPENVLSKDYNLNSGFTNEEKEKLFYYKACITYSNKVMGNIDDNSKRAKSYDKFFSLTLLLLLVTTVFVTIAYHPLSVKS